MENVLDILPIGVFVLDAQFQVAEVNKTLAEFFGIPQEQMLGQDKKWLARERISRIIENGYAFSARVLATYRDNTYIERFVCHVLPGKNREERWLQHSSRPIITGSYQGGRIESYTDITGLILAEQEIQWITTESLQLQEKEKARIASNLHDELGQTVLAIRFSLENLQASLMKRADSSDSELRELQKSISWVEKLGAEVRDISSALMPPLLGPLGLDETLVWLAEQYSSIAGVDIRYQSFGVQKKRFSESLEVAIFRVFQESLNNILKHASAQHVDLRLVYSHPRIIVNVTDDGKGFDTGDGTAVGIGLKIMRQRVREWGGTMTIMSQVGKGTTVRAEFPVP